MLAKELKKRKNKHTMRRTMEGLFISSVSFIEKLVPFCVTNEFCLFLRFLLKAIGNLIFSDEKDAGSSVAVDVSKF